MSDPKGTRPVIGVAAVIWKKDHFLLIQRGQPPREGEWSLPGGHQEFGETVKQAVIREVAEETGLDVRLGPLVDVVDAIMAGGKQGSGRHYTLIDYMAEWIAGEAIAASDARAIKWVELADLEKYDLWQETKRIILMSAHMRS